MTEAMTEARELLTIKRYASEQRFDPAIVELGTMAEPVTIKKYPNRRLFNPGTGSYVTLQHLTAMVQADEDFTITETATGEDITESVLKQITVERGRHG